MLEKRVLSWQRMRIVPRQFSWIDQRLVHDKYIQRCDCRALGLYLLLVTVGDAKGLSYYSDEKAAMLLSLPADELAQARRQLVRCDLIAYERPLYQVLALPLETRDSVV